MPTSSTSTTRTCLKRRRRSASQQEDAKPIQYTIELKGGTRLPNVTTKTEKLKVEWEFGELEIPWLKLYSLSRESGGTACELLKGDRLFVKIKTDSISVQTELGDLEIPVEKLKRIDSPASLEDRKNAPARFSPYPSSSPPSAPVPYNNRSYDTQPQSYNAPYPAGYQQPDEPLIFTSEQLRQITEEWHRIWFEEYPDHLTPYRTHGGII